MSTMSTTCLLMMAVLQLFISTLAAPPQPLSDWRIVNGTDVPQGKYPSQISLQQFNSHSCGGSILNANFAMTAAHCTYRMNPSNIKVLAGTVTLNQGGTKHAVLEIIQHEGYDPNKMFIHDIAVIRVDPPFELGVGDVASVTLPTQGQDSPGGSPGTVIGWGYPKSGGNVMNTLQEVDLVVVSDEDCERIHNNMPHPTNICAGVPEGGKGQCSGDSGGPLFVNGYQAGIVSWSVKPCTIAPYPGVYTEVSPYVDWINSKIN